MSPLPLLSVILVCALVPAGARAQSAPPLVPAAEPQPQDTQPPEPQEESPYRFRTRPQSSRLHVVPRVGLEVLTGSVGTVTGAIAGLIVGVAIRGEAWCLNGSDDDCEASSALRGAIPLLLLTSGGAALGVYGIGTYAADGAGLFLPTFGGAALATVGSLITFAALPPESEYLPLLVGALVLPTVGAILGYEISQAWVDSRATPERAVRADTGIQLVPVVARSPGGGFLGGRAGRF